jgi:hypothetical protein
MNRLIDIAALVVLTFLFATGFIALLAAIGAYELAREASERIDTLWNELFDDEIEALRNEGEL